MQHLQTGLAGEQAAVTFLKRQHYQVLECRFSCRLGEIDIVAKDGVAYVFVEVRTRGSDSYGTPAETVTRSKQKKIIKTALFYAQVHALEDIQYRFDVIEISLQGKQQINHIINAF